MIFRRSGFRIGMLIGLLLLASLLLLPFGNSGTIEVPTRVSNVFHEPLSDEWDQISQTLALDESQYGVRDFQLDYSPDGELRKLVLSIFEITDAAKKTLYRIALDQGSAHYIITKARANSLDVNDSNRLQTPLMFETLTPETFKALVPPENGDFVRLTFDSYYHSAIPSMPSGSQIYSLRDQQVIGPLLTGNGYLTEIWSMQEKENGAVGQSPYHYLLGGI